MKLLFLADGRRNQTKDFILHFYEKGYEIELISPFPFPHLEINVHLIPNCLNQKGELKKFWYLLQARRIKRLIYQIRPDILHALYATNYGFIGAVSHYHPLVLTTFGTDILVTPGKNLFYRFITGYALKQADLINSVAPHITYEIVKKSITPQKILTFPRAADFSQIEYSPRDPQRHRARYTVLTIEHLEGGSNFENLIRVIPKVLAFKENVWFIVFCSAARKAQLKALASQYHVLEHVAFPDLNNGLRIDEYYRMADIYLSIPTVDGMPYKLFEAMAYGGFPILSKIAAYDKLLINGEDGFYVMPDDINLIAQRIVETLDQPELRSRAAAANYQKIMNLTSLDKNLEMLEFRYMNLVEKAE